MTKRMFIGLQGGLMAALGFVLPIYRLGPPSDLHLIHVNTASLFIVFASAAVLLALFRRYRALWAVGAMQLSGVVFLLSHCNVLKELWLRDLYEGARELDPSLGIELPPLHEARELAFSGMGPGAGIVFMVIGGVLMLVAASSLLEGRAKSSEEDPG